MVQLRFRILLLLLLLLSTFSNQIVRNDCPSDTSLGQGIAFASASASAFASAFAFASALESDSESGPLTDCNIISHTYVGLAWAHRLSRSDSGVLFAVSSSCRSSFPLGYDFDCDSERFAQNVPNCNAICLLSC